MKRRPDPARRRAAPSEPLKVTLSAPDIGEAELEAVLSTLASPRLSIGPRLREFEEAFSRLVGASAVAVSSGTAALHLCLLAAGVGEGDAVVTSPFSFVASANAILFEKAVPVFVDVDPATGNIAPGPAAAKLRELHRRGRPAKAVLPVHVFGTPVEIEAIAAAAEEVGAAVIEDACEALGATWRGRPVGSLGDAAAFGFYPNKQITTGEGGMAVASRPEWAELFRQMRNHGRDASGESVRLGYNYRMDEMSAALGLAQLRRLDEILAKRARVAGWYLERLAGWERVQTPSPPPENCQCWFVFVVRIKPPGRRDGVIKALQRQGVPSRPYFRPIHLQRLYRERFGFSRGDFPVAERLGDVSLALPFSAVMTEAEVDFVCRALGRALGKGS